MRLLGNVEHSFAVAHADANGSAMGCFVTYLRGKISLDHLETAFLESQNEHWALQQRIERVGSKFRFVQSDYLLKGRHVHREDDKTWIQVAGVEQNTPLHEERGEVMRFVLISDQREAESDFEIIITVHHAIADAASMIPLMIQVLEKCTGLKSPQTPKPVGEEHPPIDKLSPLCKSPIRWLLGTIGVIFSELWKALRYPIQPVTIEVGDCKRTQTGLVYRTLEPPVAEALIKNTRSFGSTMTGVLMACAIEAVGEELYPNSPRCLRTSLAVNLRSELSDSSVRHALACYVGGIVQPLPYRIAGEFWEQSKRISKQIKNSMAAKLPWIALPMFRLNGFLMVKAPRASAAALHASNMGVSPLPEAIGGIKLRGCNALLCANGVGRSIVMMVSTYQNRIRIVFNYSTLHVHAEEAERVANRTIENLNQMVVT